MDASMWDDFPGGLSAEAAKPKRPAQDAPTQQPMRANIKPAQQRKPSADQKRVRRQMARQANTGSFPACPSCGSTESTAFVDGTYQGLATCNACGAVIDQHGGTTSPAGTFPTTAARQAASETREPLHCDYCGGVLVGDYTTAGCSSCGRVFDLTDHGDAARAGLLDGEVVRIGIGDVAYRQPITTASTHASSSTSTTTKESTAMSQPTEQELMDRLAKASTLVEQAAISTQIDALRAARRESLSAESSLDWDGMGALPPTREQRMAQMLTRSPGALPPATASVRLGTTDATDWLDDITPTETEDHVLSARVRAEATRWFEGVWAPVKQDQSEFSVQAKNAAVRSGTQYGLQSTAAMSVFMDQVRHLASREGITLIAADEDTGVCSKCGYNIHSVDGTWKDSSSDASCGMGGSHEPRGKEASRRHAFDETVDTYVSDGKTTQPVGVEPEGDSLDEWTIGTDLNGGTDPKSTNSANAPSLSEGDTPEQATDEGIDNPNFGQTDVDKSTYNVGDTSDKMTTQGRRYEAEKRPEGTVHATKNGNGEGTLCGADGQTSNFTPWVNCEDCKKIQSGASGEGDTTPSKDSGNFRPVGRRTAGTYAGGSPKHGDTAVCHADGKPIEFFDGQWMHYAGGPSHNDVWPGTPKEVADGTAMGSRRGPRLALHRTAGIDVSKVRIEDRASNLFSGETNDGTRVTFRLSDSDAADVRSVMFGDLAQNFSGLTIEQSDIVSEQGGGNSMNGPSRSASLSIEAQMAAEFGSPAGRGIQTYAQEEQSTSADGLSSARAPEDAPSMSEGDEVEGDHSEPATQEPGQGAQDLSQARPTDNLHGVNWGSTASRKTAAKECPRPGCLGWMYEVDSTGDVFVCTSCGHNLYAEEVATLKDASRKHADGPTNTFPCADCGTTVERWRGEYDVNCPSCGAPHNAGGQRLRDDWAGNASNWDENVSDMDGFENQQSRYEGKRRQPTHTLAQIAASFSGKPVSQTVATLAQGLSAVGSMRGQVGGVSARQIVSTLASHREVPLVVRLALNEHLAAETGDGTSVKVKTIPGCDICKAEFSSATPNPAVVDGKTKMGPWANMCEYHFSEYGVGLGVGRGQRLVQASRRTAGQVKWRISGQSTERSTNVPEGEDAKAYIARAWEVDADKIEIIGGESKEGRRAPFVREAAKSDECPECGSHMDDVVVNGDTLTARCDNCGWSGTKRKPSKSAARDTGTCAECGRGISYDGSEWYHDNEGPDTNHPAKKAAARRTASSVRDFTCLSCGHVEVDDRDAHDRCEKCGSTHYRDEMSGKVRNAPTTASRRTAASDLYGERGACIKCGTDVEFVDVDLSDFEKQYGSHGDHAGWWDRGGNFSCPEGGFHESTGSGENADFFEQFFGGQYKRSSRRTAADKPQCEHAGEHHSDDVTAVYHGRTEPTYLCGFHASQVDDFGKFPRRESTRRTTASTSAVAEESSKKFTQTDRGDGYWTAKCKNCGGDIRRKDMASSGWTHSRTNTKWCPEGGFVASFAQRVQAGLSRVAEGGLPCPECGLGAIVDGSCSECGYQFGGDTFSLSDAKNEDGEWIMSPEQIRAEMYYEGARRTAASDWLAAARRVVENHQYEEIDGILLDAQTANVLVKVHDALSPEKQAQFVAMPLQQAANIGWKLVSGKTSAVHTDGSGAWKAQVAGSGESVWSGNGLTFDTPEEAKAWIADLSMKWFGFDLGRVVPADTPTREPVDLSDPQITHNFR